MKSSMPEQMLQMLIPIAEALGEDLLPKFAFVGGSTTALLITDPVTKQAVRFTDDVDLIFKANNHAHWQSIQKQLRKKGFRESMDDDIICRMRLGELKVDFMPDDERILGFSNRWYKDALTTAQSHKLTKNISINILMPVYFIATKLEAYRGRGNNDPINSHDLEDIINLVDGREELLTELADADGNVRHYIAEHFTNLLLDNDFEYAVQGNIGDAARTDILLQRMEQISKL